MKPEGMTAHAVSAEFVIFKREGEIADLRRAIERMVQCQRIEPARIIGAAALGGISPQITAPAIKSAISKLPVSG
jgi:hypothetical protein